MEKFVPFLLKWETGTVAREGESNESLFARAANKGYYCDPDDLGGATMCGVTIATFTKWRRSRHQPTPTVADLKVIGYDEWKLILKSEFWDKWRADEIRNQTVAEILVDWLWTSGASTVRRVQKILGVNADGVVGPKTVAAINSREPSSLCRALTEARILHIDEICRRRPLNNKFRTGWLRRIAAVALFRQS